MTEPCRLVYVITLPLNTMKQSSPQKIRPIIAPVQMKWTSRPAARQMVAPSTAPNIPPITATAHRIIGQVTAAAQNPPRMPPGSAPPSFEPISAPTATPTTAAFSVTRIL